jgi:hypothetical protein
MKEHKFIGDPTCATSLCEWCHQPMNHRVHPEARVPINIHPSVKARLTNLLMTEPALKGIGYSDFIDAAILSWEKS